MTESEIVLAFGENLRRIIEARGITRNKLSKITKISKRNIYRYLGFESMPRLEHLAELCTALNCDPAELYKMGVKK